MFGWMLLLQVGPPAWQAVPFPHDQISFQRDGAEVARYHFGGDLRRPFVFPVIGPGGRMLTRMGHPHDPVGHSHHNSVWISHHKVDGVSFWSDQGGRIVHQRVERLDDGPSAAAATVLNHWTAPDGRVVLVERRRLEAREAGAGEWMLLLDLELSVPPGRAAVTIEQDPFGPIGVRVAKSMGVKDGGGRIVNSEGQVDEAGCFRKPARWVDYSGPVARDEIAGLTLMDHPANPGHPSPFHVRDDGWMGACLSLDRAVRIPEGRPLTLRYGIYVHGGALDVERVEARWKAFAPQPKKP
jgi:hypothetical protein